VHTVKLPREARSADYLEKALAGGALGSAAKQGWAESSQLEGMAKAIPSLSAENVIAGLMTE